MIKNINIDNIRENMILCNDIVNDNGVVILSKGHKVTEPIKVTNVLRMYRIYSINVEIKDVEQFVDVSNNSYEKSAEFIYKDDKQIKEIISFKENMSMLIDELKRKFNSLHDGNNLNQEELEGGIDELLDLCEGNINIFQLLEKIKYIDDAIYLHSYSVGFISYTIGKWLNFKEHDLRNLVIAGIFSDFGKIKLDEKILYKVDKFTKKDIKHVRNHVLYSYSMIKNIDYIDDSVKLGVLYHHEREDGSGYPSSLKGQDIPLYAKIIAIADIYSAITSIRCYRRRKTPFEAIYILESEYMDKLDPTILLSFTSRIKDMFVGNKVKLSNNKIGTILFIPQQSMYNPVIQIDETHEIIDLSKDKNIRIVSFY